ncbi:MAG: HEPN domain-containing protein [Parcubacteria group bacterium]|nr:HEPN domain-containing protein [Parcubacteria group bacterium]
MVIKISPQNRKKQASLLIKNAKERIKSSKILLENKLYNDAISRAYYAFFDAASSLLVTKGLMAKTHAGIINLFSLHFIKTKDVPVKYIKYFRQAKTAREEADYEILRKFSQEETEEIITIAEDFIKFIKNNVL